MKFGKSSRDYFLFMGGLLLVLAGAVSSQSTTSATPVTVYKQPT
jgi:hypothetical protein